MSKAPAFQFYPERFTMGCALMAPADVGCYILMLCHQWEHGALPNDAIALQMLCRSNAPIGEKVMEKFAAGEDGLLRNEVLEKVRSEQTAYRERIGTARRNAANKRWSDANAKQMQSKSNAINEVEVGGSKSSGKERAGGKVIDLPFLSEPFALAWAGFEQMRTKKRKPMTDQARALIIADLRKMGEPDAITALNNSIRSGWTDVYPPKGSTTTDNAQRRDLKTTW